MKVISKSQGVPISMIVIGGLMATMSSMEFADQNNTTLFVAGWFLILFGILAWFIPELGRYLRKKQRSRMRAYNREPTEGPQGRRRAPQRR